MTYTTHEPCPAEVGPPMPPGEYRDVWSYQRIQRGVLGDECRYLCPVDQEQGAHDGMYYLVRVDRLSEVSVRAE